MSMSEAEVFTSVKSERIYQRKQLSDGNPMFAELTLGDTLTAIQSLLNEATGEWYYSEHGDYYNPMLQLRRIAALCVQAGEKYGMPSREREQELRNREADQFQLDFPGIVKQADDAGVPVADVLGVSPKVVASDFVQLDGADVPSFEISSPEVEDETTEDDHPL